MNNDEMNTGQNDKTGDAGTVHPPVRKKSTPVLLTVCICIILVGSAVLLYGPELRLPVGTCGADTITMTFTSTVVPTYTESLLHEFGEAEPDPAPAIPPMLDYPPKKDVIDTLLARAQVVGGERSVIGMFEFPDTRLILVTTGSNVTEVLADNESIRTYTLIPRYVGSRNSRTSLSREDALALHPRDRTYISLTESNDTIQRIDLVLPVTGDTTVPLYWVNKTRTDTFHSVEGAEVFSVTTTGTFYIIYGEQVESVTYGSAVSHDPEWKVCSEKIGFTRNGMNGELRNTVKFARSSERVLVAYLAITSPFLQVTEGNMGSSISQWDSRDSSGCSC
ncbi:hypothetical protein [Methanoregula sp.]|jgi:hypothetical protein|uniref:hypothetical protein n=1 Tax=Methanoregula sp. TaxID=2052170 RepID=UPI00261027E6|nr:hypothetical protein [Methanoregula sp.]MDD5143352.1 hypothetical protein [Methanoregula sp.]